MQIRTIKSKVKELLTKYPALRDSNERLYLNYLAMYHDIDVKVISIYQLFSNENWKDIARLENVARCSRTLQEKHKELRGTQWYLRHNHQEEVLNDLGYRK